jgi:hypothetical protein
MTSVSQTYDTPVYLIRLITILRRILIKDESEIIDFRPPICTPANKCLQSILDLSRANTMARKA